MTRTVDFRYIVVRNGADFTELRPIRDASPLLIMNEGAEIKMSFSGSFAADDSINWLTDQIRPELVIDDVASPLGVYLPATVTPSEDESTRSVQVEAYDRCWLVRDTYTETIRHFSAGSLYTDVVRQLAKTVPVPGTARPLPAAWSNSPAQGRGASKGISTCIVWPGGTVAGSSAELPPALSRRTANASGAAPRLRTATRTSVNEPRSQ